jgi:uncharacterized membrane protein YdjX (TVP38/TMEM64 family)
MATASTRREYISLTVVGAILVAAVFIVRAYDDSIKEFIDRRPVWGLFLYITMNIFDAVIAPGATLPLIPIAAHVWGPVLAALATTAGWTAGSLIAFLIARRWGAPLVRKLTSFKRVQAMRRYIPEDLFWSIVLVRLVLPMDVISYVLGLFTDIGLAKYVAATAIGLTPSALLLAYLGKLPNAYEILAFGVGGMVIVASLLITRRRQRTSRHARLGRA